MSPAMIRARRRAPPSSVLRRQYNMAIKIRNWKSVLSRALFVLLFLVALVPWGGLMAHSDEEGNIAIYEKTAPSVVNIVNTTVSYDFFLQPVPSTGSGSAVIVDDSGHIVTNYHVIEGAKSPEVTLLDR